ncbi:MAG: prophage MuMc02, head decoration protein [candidate division NC10 bacterium CSP1-5]|nr:MAG: prophage MuMc02, head decoration protein [candidate division NC10 bacterium CSP1-5]KRT69464.1 MAG: prophage MuMc02, head decoration protein [candidate division NC10 bacterium CSP1-5]
MPTSANLEDLILRDTAANRPAAGTPGRIFYDTTNEKWQRDTGSSWEDCEPAPGSFSLADVKDSVRAATTANITLSGEQTIDGVSVVAVDRVLVKDQSAGAENGIYVAASGAWSRAIDANTSAEVTPGMFVFVEEGTVNGDQGFVLTTNAPITLGTTALSFTQFSGGGGSDTTAIHDDAAGEIAAITEKASPVSGDLLLIEDSAASNAKKRVQIGNLPGGTDAAAIHDDTAGEIAAITEKTTPVAADLFLIEDSAASNAKKRVQIGNLPKLNSQLLSSIEGVLVVTTGKLRFYNETGRTLTISKVKLAVDTAPVGAAIIVDVHKNGVTVFTTQSNRPQIAAAANEGESTTIEVPSWADGDYLTVDVDQIGSSTAGSDLTVHVIYS